MYIPFSTGLLRVTEKEKKKKKVTEQIVFPVRFVPNDISNYKNLDLFKKKKKKFKFNTAD